MVLLPNRHNPFVLVMPPPRALTTCHQASRHVVTSRAHMRNSDFEKLVKHRRELFHILSNQLIRLRIYVAICISVHFMFHLSSLVSLALT
ncbi:hypothetical protein Plim_1502 [Planctopirus limnophila DSM 3776]|uniref:Uncharacterized protein n=1 Tax=Planctopirus limnophila (strain ATCC 43296 / DSM 3776 / IFAM 1008 / Mu 290) TaxID=521674 RepID=D5SW50_PLAL2|nr:hypothetical protein Plim_1502 [Planctopirus limnophila DSM 3776]